MQQIDLFESEIEYDPQDPAGYRGGVVQIADATGAEETAIRLFELPAGENLGPYHYEYVEEWLLVLDGQLTVRTPDGEQAASAGSLVRFPSGPTGAHKLSNRDGKRARFLMFSSSRKPAVSVYPDSDKIAVWPGRKEDHVVLRRADGQADYYDGEV